MKSKYCRKDRIRKSRIAAPAARKAVKRLRSATILPPEPAAYDEIEEAPGEADPFERGAEDIL